jgi:hypothetical protein
VCRSRSRHDALPAVSSTPPVGAPPTRALWYRRRPAPIPSAAGSRRDAQRLLAAFPRRIPSWARLRIVKTRQSAVCGGSSGTGRTSALILWRTSLEAPPKLVNGIITHTQWGSLGSATGSRRCSASRTADGVVVTTSATCFPSTDSRSGILGLEPVVMESEFHSELV